MVQRVHNFNPGPAALPLPVLERAGAELVDYHGTGMSILETSHRSPEYGEVNASAQALIRELLGLDPESKVLLLTSGASMQFAMVPMNLLGEGRSADYVVTGAWSKKAVKEAKLFGKVNIAASTEEESFTRLPKADELKLDPSATYVHLTSNNTIFGTQFHSFPDTGEVPLVADMSSDILSHRFDANKFGIIYAGAQKNLGPSGVTVVILRKDMLERCNEGLPTMLTYGTHVAKDSLFNTPPVFAVYFLDLVLRWVKEQGGLDAMEQINRRKGELLYGLMDEQSDFFRGTVEKESRSLMNVTMRLPSEELEKRLIAEGAAKGFKGLKGHRSVGGIRVSMYNATSALAIEQLVDFMKEFRKTA
jgi:phosphoserine aminotransferase